MRLAIQRFAAAATALGIVAAGAWAMADETLPPVTKRFAAKEVKEVPDFQKHVVPLFGRLGCNGLGGFQAQCRQAACCGSNRGLNAAPNKRATIY